MHEWCSTKISIFWLNQSIPHHSRGPMDSEPLWLRYFGDLFFRIPIKSTSSKSFTYTLKLILYVIQRMEFLKILSYWINLIIKHNNNKKRRYMYLVRGDNDHDSKMKFSRFRVILQCCKLALLNFFLHISILFFSINFIISKSHVL